MVPDCLGIARGRSFTVLLPAIINGCSFRCWRSIADLLYQQLAGFWPLRISRCHRTSTSIDSLLYPDAQCKAIHLDNLTSDYNTYVQFQDKLSHAYLIQMSFHAHFVVLALLILILTAVGIRSQYLCLISLIFYGGALLLNLLSTLHDRGETLYNRCFK